MNPQIDSRLIAARQITNAANASLGAALPFDPAPPLLAGILAAGGSQSAEIGRLATEAANHPVTGTDFDDLVNVLLNGLPAQIGPPPVAAIPGIGAIRAAWQANVVNSFPAATPNEDPHITDARDSVVEAGRQLAEIFRDLSMLQGTGGPSAALLGINDGVQSINAYPLLTTEIAAASMGGGIFAAPTDIGQQVDAAFREVIGRLPRADDPRTLQAALANTFTITEEKGMKSVAWRPRTYGGQTQLGGGVTGAQASLFARAKDAADTIVPLLNSLVPVLPDADPEETAAARSMVISQFEAVLEEFATEGGPTADRVDRLLNTLLIDTNTGAAGTPVTGGLVGLLGFTYGFVTALGTPRTQLINTLLEEEQHSTYVLIQDYITSVRTSWIAFRTLLSADFGTRLVLLSRALQVTGESVDEVLRAMDSVFFGSAERAVTSFTTRAGNPMLVSELLSWVQRFALEDAPALVRDGGRRGLGPVIADAARLNPLLEDLLNNLNDPAMPAGIRQARVQNPLRELGTYLARVEQLAQSIR
jgi:hypothetical protein